MKIKNLLLFIYYLFFFQLIIAQYYTCIKPDYRAYYGQNHLAIKLDSVTTQSDTLYYHNFKMIRNASDGYYKLGDSWTGKDIIILPNGYNLFINRDSDTISINTLADLNEKWRFYTFPDDRYVEAEVTSITEEEFIGINDDVKTINLQLKDVNGNNIDDPINDSYLKLSKHYGLSRIFYFYIFPYFIDEMNITGFSLFGHQNFGAKEIFDFAVNDEIHTHYMHYKFQEYHWEEWKIMKVLDKVWSNNGNTVTYTVDLCRKIYFEGNVDSYHNIGTVIYDFQDPEYAKLSNTNFEPYYEFDGYNHNYYLTRTHYDEKRICKIYSGSNINQLYLAYSEDPDFTKRKYFLKGLGGEYWSYGSMCSREENKIVYYKKGDVEWGYPYNCSYILDTKDYNTNIKIYPNPVDTQLTLELNSSNYSIIITNISGKKIFEKLNNGNITYIDTSSFLSGVYVVQIISGEKVFNRKIIVKH